MVRAVPVLPCDQEPARSSVPHRRISLRDLVYNYESFLQISWELYSSSVHPLYRLLRCLQDSVVRVSVAADLVSLFKVGVGAEATPSAAHDVGEAVRVFWPPAENLRIRTSSASPSSGPSAQGAVSACFEARPSAV